MADRFKAMVGFRNIAVHDDQLLLVAIVKEIIEKHFNDFQAFARSIIELKASGTFPICARAKLLGRIE